MTRTQARYVGDGTAERARLLDNLAETFGARWFRRSDVASPLWNDRRVVTLRSHGLLVVRPAGRVLEYRVVNP